MTMTIITVEMKRIDVDDKQATVLHKMIPPESEMKYLSSNGKR